jgi:hypothetical protein
VTYARLDVRFTTVADFLVAIVIARLGVARNCALPATTGGGAVGSVTAQITGAAILNIAVDIRFATVGRVIVAIGIAFVGAGRVAADPASADLRSHADDTASTAIRVVSELVYFATVAVFLVAIEVVVFAVDAASAIETLSVGAWFITTGSARSAVGRI